MSATARATATRPAGRPQGQPRPAAAPRRRADLREVPAPAQAVAGTGIFSLVVIGILVGGAVLLLVLNTSLAQGAFELAELGKEQRDLAVSEQTLLQEVAKAESPESLQRRAERLGMVPVSSPVFLRLADGKVLGIPRAAEADPSARRVPLTGTAPRPSAAPTAAAAASGASAGTGPSATGTAGTANAAAAATAGDAAVADPLPVDDAAAPDEGAAP